jgi:diguanylate cyclase (GGDEF)-like protein
MDSEKINVTLRRCATGLAAFIVCILSFVALLIRTDRSRRHALDSLHAAHRALAAASEIERRRASILEMVGSHAGLDRTLNEIASIASQCGSESGAAIWIGDGERLALRVSFNLPQGFAESLQRHLPPAPGPSESRIERFGGYTGALAEASHLAGSAPKELKEASGERIGMLQMFAPARSTVHWETALQQMAQLAAVAIENSLLYERLAFQAQHDALTGLPNRLLFQDRVQQAARLAVRRHGKAAVIWINLDNYKLINDTLGHRAGDEILCEMARRLEALLRQSDTVARVGGDDFTVLAQDLAQPCDAELVAAKILSTLARPFRLGSELTNIGASLGISLIPDHGEDPVTLLRHADLAMHSAKRAGGNAFQTFRSALSDSLQRRMLIERELRSALGRNELTLEYQPLVDGKGNIDCVETLLRWDNPAAGPVSPAEFIPIAEEAGLIPVIGEWVARTACREGSRWFRRGYRVPRVAVNVSALQFADGKFDALIERLLAETEFPAAKLELEITETALMDNLASVIEQIENLRRLGVRFAIDDFGTGYSSLSHLQNLPVDCVKIDRSFVKDLASESSASTTLVRGIISLAHNLRLQVVAEGVETAQQLALLHMLGCDLNQGFFLHRPMPAEALEILLHQPPDGAESRIPESESLLFTPDLA